VFSCGRKVPEFIDVVVLTVEVAFDNRRLDSYRSATLAAPGGRWHAQVMSSPRGAWLQDVGPRQGPFWVRRVPRIAACDLRLSVLSARVSLSVWILWSVPVQFALSGLTRA